MTCIFHPDNRAGLRPGALKLILESALAKESAIPCHEIMESKTPAICRGFYDTHRSQVLQIAERLGVLELQG